MKDGEVRDFGRRDKIGYMFGDFGNDFTFIFASSFLMVFYTKVLGISGGMVGTLFLVARFVDAFTHRRRSAAGAGWKVPMLDPQDVRTGGAVEFFDVPDCHGAGIYAVEDCLHVCYLSFVGKYFLYIDQHSVWFDGICDHDGGIGADGVIYLPVDWGDTGGACDRHRDAAFSVHDRCRRQSGRARRRNIYGGCGHFLDSRVDLLSGLLPHDYGAGGGGA